MLDKHFLNGSILANNVHLDERFKHGNKPEANGILVRGSKEFKK
jgi:hypothetical protein